MIDPEKITKFGRTRAELEEFLLFCVVVAGKNARSQSRLLDAYLYTLPQAKTPFRRIRKSMHNGTFDELLFNSRLGKYGLLKTCFYHLVGFDGTDYVPSLNVETCTLDDLQAVYGIGPKTARFFLLHSRPNQRYSSK